MIISFLLALAVKSGGTSRSSRIYKMIIFLPQMCAVVAASLVFKVIFGGEVGVINQVLGTHIAFLNELDIIKWPVTALIVWRSTGWFFGIYLSGLTTISDEIMDAALIDGAGHLRTYRDVVLPTSMPALSALGILVFLAKWNDYLFPRIMIDKLSVMPGHTAYPERRGVGQGGTLGAGAHGLRPGHHPPARRVHSLAGQIHVQRYHWSHQEVRIMRQLKNLKAKMAEGKTVFGIFVTFADCAVSEIAGYAGCDFVWIDAEHGALDRREIYHHVMAAQSSGAAALVRVPGVDPHYVKAIMDMGADGIIFPSSTPRRRPSSPWPPAPIPPPA